MRCSFSFYCFFLVQQDCRLGTFSLSFLLVNVYIVWMAHAVCKKKIKYKWKTHQKQEKEEKTWKRKTGKTFRALHIEKETSIEQPKLCGKQDSIITSNFPSKENSSEASEKTIVCNIVKLMVLQALSCTLACLLTRSFFRSLSFLLYCRQHCFFLVILPSLTFITIHLLYVQCCTAFSLYYCCKHYSTQSNKCGACVVGRMNLFKPQQLKYFNVMRLARKEERKEGEMIKWIQEIPPNLYRVVNEAKECNA